MRSLASNIVEPWYGYTRMIDLRCLVRGPRPWVVGGQFAWRIRARSCLLIYRPVSMESRSRYCARQISDLTDGRCSLLNSIIRLSCHSRCQVLLRQGIPHFFEDPDERPNVSVFSLCLESGRVAQDRESRNRLP